MTINFIRVKLTKNDELQNINIKIKDYEFVIEYLEKVEKIMGGMGFDIKNIIEIQKLEQL